MDVNAKHGQGALAGFWKKRNAAHPAAALLADLAAMAAVFLLARTHLLFGAYPLGIALLCALRGWTVLGGALGALLGALGMGRIGYIYGAMALIALLMRFAVSIPGKGRRFLPDSEGVFKEMPQLRAAIACIVGFSAALYQLLVAGPTTATLLFSATMLIAPTAGALLFSGLTDASLSVEELLGRTAGGALPERGRGESLRLSVGALALGFFLTAALSVYSLFGLSVAYLFAGAATLAVSRRCGALRASVLGLLITLGASPLYAPAFALLGLLSGALWELGSFYALALGVAGGAVWASYVGQLQGFLSVAPELLLVALVLAPLLSGIGSADAVSAGRERAERGRRAVDRLTLLQDGERESAVSALESGLRGLSEALRGVADSASGAELSEYLHAVSCAAAPHCAVCPRRLACSGRDAAEQKAAEMLLRGERPELADLDESFVHDCGSIGVILSDATAAVAELHEDGAAARSLDTLSGDLGLLAELISDAAERDSAECRPDRSLAVSLCDMLSERGVGSEAAAVSGTRKKRILLGGIRADSELPLEELREEMEHLSGCRLSPITVSEEGDALTLSTEATERYRTETCRAYRAARTGEVSGDTVTFFEGREGRFYALLSDGMGSGRRAAITSGIASLVLQHLLGAGCPKTASLKLLNNLLRASGEESSATVDLLELDLLSGQATFIKSGAAPSYVKRGENLFRIRSRTVSVGLTESLDAEKIRFEAEPGDVIVMLSDGVSQTPEDAPWLMEILSGELEEDLSAAAERIVGVAAGTHERRDDMTVALVRVCECGSLPRVSLRRGTVTEATVPAACEGALEAAI